MARILRRQVKKNRGRTILGDMVVNIYMSHARPVCNAYAYNTEAIYVSPFRAALLQKGRQDH